MRKNYITMLELQEYKNPCFKHIKVSFCMRANEANKQQSM